MIRKIKNIYHLLEAIIANILYDNPGRRISVVGVTGTDGKTTTTHMIYHILKSAGKKVSMSSSIYADIAGDIVDTGLHVTTQSRWKIQSNLRKAIKNGDDYFILETTSHGIDQYRIWGIHFKVGVLTNITKEHLDYHKTFKNYLETKTKLLLSSEHAVINYDDESYDEVIKILKAHHKSKVSYGLKKDADYIWSTDIKTSIKEDFNKQNMLAAYACCSLLGLRKDEILKGIASFKLPKGRVDIVYQKDFTVIIDFAHTPYSIRQLLKNITKQYRGRIIHIFGSAGKRDQQKREDMGRASAEFAQGIILTEEDYRTENFYSICKSIEKGILENDFTFATPENFDSKKHYTIIENRNEAIICGIKNAKKGDVVIITGKSHEKSLARGFKEYPWDEYKAVEKAISIKYS